MQALLSELCARQAAKDFKLAANLRRACVQALLEGRRDLLPELIKGSKQVTELGVLVLKTLQASAPFPQA